MEHKTLWQKNADFAFEPNEYAVNKKVKTEEVQATQEAEAHGVCLKDLEGYQIVKVKGKMITLRLKTKGAKKRSINFTSQNQQLTGIFQSFSFAGKLWHGKEHSWHT